MRTIGILSVTLTVVFCIASEACALGFGADEKIHSIQDIDGTGYRLCYKTTTQFFGLGIYLKDDGYVLQEYGMRDRYIPLADVQIRDMQDEGLLPDPLPTYTISPIEYGFGYSLWILIAVVLARLGLGGVCRYLISAHRRRRLLTKPHYQEAIKIALSSESNGINEAVDYLRSKGVRLAEAQRNMQLLLSSGATTAI